MENPNYFAIIPATVRYDKNLSASEKLMFAEITSLSQTNGYCYAQNNYFAELYNVSKETVSRWVSNLAKNNYISIDMRYKEGTKEIQSRIIKLYPIDKNINTYCEKHQYPIDKNIKDNNTSINNIKEIYKESFEEFWKEYPKQRAGSKEKAFNAYLRKVKEVECPTYLTAKAKEYALSDEVKKGFAKGCAAWLNDDRFNNDYSCKYGWGIGQDGNPF